MAKPRDLIGLDLSTLDSDEINSLYNDYIGATNPQKNIQGLETLGSIAGGIAAGAAAGTLGAGPVGTVVGGIAGGMAGAFGGELLEDLLEGKDLNYKDATKEAAISAGFDVATLGAGKLVRPVFRLTGSKSLNDNYTKLLNVAKAGQGTKASLAQTQQMLQEGGASLNPRAIEDVGFITKMLNEVAEVGMVSSRYYEKDRKMASDVIKNNILKFSEGGVVTDQLGESLYNVINMGNKATRDYYGKELDKIILNAPSVSNIPTNKIGFRIGDFQTKYTDDTGSILAPQTQEIFEDIRKIIIPENKAIKVNVKTLLNLQKRLNSFVDDAMPGGAKANGTVARELTELSQFIKKGIEDTLEAKVPGVYKDYANLNSTFKDLLEGILPELNAGQFLKAKKGDFDAMGNLFLTQTNISKIDAFMKSIDKSFEALKANKSIDSLPEGLRSPESVKSLIRSSYARNLLGDLTDDKIFNQSTVNKFNSPKLQKQMAVVFQEDWPQFKKVLNAVGDSIKTTKGGILSLALRGRELTAAFGIGAVFGLQSQDPVSGATTALTSAAGILGLPAVLYRISRNPKAVNKLIALQKRGFNSADLTPELIGSSLAKVFAELNSEDRKAIKEEAYNAGNYNLDI